MLFSTETLILVVLVIDYRIRIYTSLSYNIENNHTIHYITILYTTFVQLCWHW